MRKAGNAACASIPRRESATQVRCATCRSTSLMDPLLPSMVNYNGVAGGGMTRLGANVVRRPLPPPQMASGKGLAQLKKAVHALRHLQVPAGPIPFAPPPPPPLPRSSAQFVTPWADAGNSLQRRTAISLRAQKPDVLWLLLIRDHFEALQPGVRFTLEESIERVHEGIKELFAQQMIEAVNQNLNALQVS